MPIKNTNAKVDAIKNKANLNRKNIEENRTNQIKQIEQLFSETPEERRNRIENARDQAVTADELLELGRQERRNREILRRGKNLAIRDAKHNASVNRNNETKQEINEITETVKRKNNRNE